MAAAASYTVNGGTLFAFQSESSTIDRLGDNATITLNNTAGVNGLYTSNDQTSTRTENIGAIVLGAGHNTISANSTSTSVGEFLAASLTRDNHATALVRGTALGVTAGGRGRIRFDGTQPTLVGGGGATATTTISIVPFLIGDSSGITGLGNSFVTNDPVTNGLRPLSLVVGTGEEYVHNEAGFNALAAGAQTNNVRFLASTAAPLEIDTTAINSLVLDSSAGAVTVTGAGALQITSGAILATTTTPVTPLPGNNATLTGFTAITTAGGSTDYTIFVTPATASTTSAGLNTLTISSPLTTAAALVKSGAGILALTNTGNLFNEIYLNQGFVEVDNFNKLGAVTALNFFGGGVRLAPTFAGDIFALPWNIETGGASLDVSVATGGYTAVNGLDPSNADASDTLNIFTRAVGTTGSNGLLTIQGASSFTGTTVIRNSGLATGTTNGVELNGTTNAAINGNLEIGNVTNIDNGFDVVVALKASEQIVDTATITFRGVSGENAYFKLLGFTETVAGIAGTTNEGIIENVETTEAGVTTNGKLIVDSASDFNYTGYMRDKGTSTNTTRLEFEKRGTGTQTLVGTRVTYTGATTVTGGTLRLVDTTGFASIITNNANLTLEPTTGTWTLATGISGSGSVTKLGNGTLATTGVKNYTGATNVFEGTLLVTGSLTGTTSVQVAGEGILGGTGSINTAAPVTASAGGTVAPGAGIGTLSTGSVSLAKGSTFALEIQTATTQGTDLLAIAGILSLALSNDVVLTISDLLESAITTGTFKFITYNLGGWNGGLFTYGGNVIADDGFLMVGANTFQLDYNLDNNSVALLAVPEPGSIISLVGGLGMLVGLQRFRRRR